MKKTAIAAMGILLVLCLATVALADVPGVINYQGYLTDPDGYPISDVLDMQFTLWDDPTDTDPSHLKWTETWDTVTEQVEVSDGYYSVLLGSYTSFGAVFEDNGALWLQVEVDAEVMTTRKRVAAVAYAQSAKSADELTFLITESHIEDGAVTVSKIANGAITGDKIAGGAVGSGHIASGAVGSSQIADGTILGADIGTDALGETEIADIYVLNTGDTMTGKLTIQVTTGAFAEFGYGHSATGDGTFVVGMNNQASNMAAIALGVGNSATGSGSLAIGSQSTASGDVSTAMGQQTTASGYVSTAMGYSSTAQGDYSFAAGMSADAIGHYSTALGQGTTASGDGSFATGAGNTASGLSSTAMGWGNTASGGGSTAMGNSMTVEGEASFGVNLSSTVTPPPLTQANTMAIMGGNVGIGTATPSVDLEVDGDVKISGSLDADGLEVRIPISDSTTTIILSASGSYYLTENLTAPGDGTNMIEITTDDVTLDLNGFSLIGTNTDGENGILLDDRSNVEIRNGTVRGFGDHGIYAGGTYSKNLRVIGVRAIGNGRDPNFHSGIVLGGPNNLVRNCTAEGNGYNGIYVGHNGQVINNVSRDNIYYGIKTGYCCNIVGNTTSDNGWAGIYAYNGSVISHNIARGTTLYHGIEFHSNSTIINNVSYDNSMSGFYGAYQADACVIKNNTSYGNGDYGITVRDYNLIKNNVAYNNGSGNLTCGSNCTLVENIAP